MAQRPALSLLQALGERRSPAKLEALAATAIMVGAGLGLSACATSATTRTGSLSSYDNMRPVHSMQAKAMISSNEVALATAKTVRIEPVSFAGGAGSTISPSQRALIANVIDRTLCDRLSERYDIVASHEPADLDVRVAITRITATGRGAAAATVALRTAGMVVGVPFPVRIPMGLGAFSAEAEAVDPAGVQDAAMTWARGADAITTRARISKIGDAYALSVAFAGDMARLVETGRNPMRDMPSVDLGAHKRRVSAACAAYGKGHGPETFVGGFLGAGPELTDHGAPRASETKSD